MNIAAILADPAYPSLKAQILEGTGLHYYADKDEDLAARIGRRLAARDVASCAAYRSLLTAPGVPSEFDNLIGELTIGETYFFRQPEHFEILRSRIIPDLLQRNSGSRRLRIWSAGCATGAEPYSISLLLWREFGVQLQEWNVEILGTDINPTFLERARTAVYGPWALRDVPREILRGCFDHDPRTKTWRLRPQYAKGVSFQRHNLVSSTLFPGQHFDPFDIIFCRNVLIYFSNDRVRTLTERLGGSLAPGGWLLVGHAEVTSPGLQGFVAYSERTATVHHKPDGGGGPQTVREAPRIEGFFQPFAATKPSVPSRVSPAEAPVPGPRMPDLTEVRLLAGRGEWAHAEDLCRRIIEAEPLCAAGHFTLGLILEHRSDRGAEAAFKKSIYLDRGFALGHYHLGCCLERSGELRHARKAFDNVLSILAERLDDEQAPEGEGMTVAELKDLAQMHLELIPAR